MKTKKVFAIWYKSEYNEGLAFDGSKPFSSFEYEVALEHKASLEDVANSYGEKVEFQIVEFKVKENS